MSLTLEDKARAGGGASGESHSQLNALETEVIDLFVQLSRLVGHPCKIYNILAVAAPVLYIGPQTSHLSEIATAANCELPFFLVTHGNVEQVVVAIQQSRRVALDGGARPPAPAILSSFSKHTLLPRLISELESV
jgi:hypothetical protein